MIDCVSESGYNILFVSAVVIAVLLLVLAAYSWNKFNQAEEKRLSANSARNGKSIALIGIIVSILAVGLLIILFFGFQKKWSAKLHHWGETINPASAVASPITHISPLYRGSSGSDGYMTLRDNVNSIGSIG